MMWCFLRTVGLLLAFATPGYAQQDKAQDDPELHQEAIFWKPHVALHLGSMKEDFLDFGDGVVEAYQLVVLPSFKPPYMIRIRVMEDQAVRLDYVETDAMGGYGPGDVTVRESYVLPAETGARVLEKVRESGFWQSPPNHPSYVERPTGETVDGEEQIEVIVCSDGTHFWMEGQRGETYHRTHHGSCFDALLEPLAADLKAAVDTELKKKKNNED